jgi:hypothetical protein
VPEAVIARSGEIEPALAGSEGGIEVIFAEVTRRSGEVDPGEPLNRVAARESGLGLVEVAVRRGRFAHGGVDPAEHPFAARDIFLPRIPFADHAVGSGQLAGEPNLARAEEVFGPLNAIEAAQFRADTAGFYVVGLGE